MIWRTFDENFRTIFVIMMLRILQNLIWRKLMSKHLISRIFLSKSRERKIPWFLLDVADLQNECTEKLLRWRSFIISFMELFQKLFRPDIFLYLQSKLIFLHFSLDWIFCHFDFAHFSLLFSQITTCYKNIFTNFYRIFHKFWSISICCKSIYYDHFWS